MTVFYFLDHNMNFGVCVLTAHVHLCGTEDRLDHLIQALKQDMVDYFPEKLLLLRVGIVQPITEGRVGQGLTLRQNGNRTHGERGQDVFKGFCVSPAPVSVSFRLVSHNPH